MENRDGNLEYILFIIVTIAFAGIYAFLSLVLYTLDVDDMLAARGFGKWPFRIVVFVITVIIILLLPFLNRFFVSY
jgi:hypothetical protein